MDRMDRMRVNKIQYKHIIYTYEIYQKLKIIFKYNFVNLSRQQDDYAIIYITQGNE